MFIRLLVFSVPNVIFLQAPESSKTSPDANQVWPRDTSGPKLLDTSGLETLPALKLLDTSCPEVFGQYRPRDKSGPETSPAPRHFRLKDNSLPGTSWDGTVLLESPYLDPLGSPWIPLETLWNEFQKPNNEPFKFYLANLKTNKQLK